MPLGAASSSSLTLGLTGFTRAGGSEHREPRTRLRVLIVRRCSKAGPTPGANGGAGSPAHTIRTGLCRLGTVSVKHIVSWASPAAAGEVPVTAGCRRHPHNSLTHLVAPHALSGRDPDVLGPGSARPRVGGTQMAAVPQDPGPPPRLASWRVPDRAASPAAVRGIQEPSACSRRCRPETGGGAHDGADLPSSPRACPREPSYQLADEVGRSRPATRLHDKHILPFAGALPATGTTIEDLRTRIPLHRNGPTVKNCPLPQNLASAFDWVVAHERRLDNLAADIERRLPPVTAAANRPAIQPYFQAPAALVPRAGAASERTAQAGGGLHRPLGCASRRQWTSRTENPAVRPDPEVRPCPCSIRCAALSGSAEACHITTTCSIPAGDHDAQQTIAVEVRGRS